MPLYYNLHTMCKTLRVTPPGNSTVRSAIVNAGARPVQAPACAAQSLPQSLCVSTEVVVGMAWAKLQSTCGFVQALSVLFWGQASLLPCI